MFLLLPALRWLARHDGPLVTAGFGLVLLAAGVGISTGGLTSHQPALTRIGLAVLIVAVVYSVIAIRSRHRRPLTRSRQHQPDTTTNGSETHTHSE